MKMSQVITAGREAIPQLCSEVEELSGRITSHLATIKDMNVVESESGREAIRIACVNEAAEIAQFCSEVRERLNGFASLLGSYKRKFKKKKTVEDKTMPFGFMKDMAPTSSETEGTGQ